MLSRLLALFNDDMRLTKIYLGVLGAEYNVAEIGDLCALIAGYHNDKIREEISVILAIYPRNDPRLCQYSALFDNIHLLLYLRDSIGYIADDSAVFSAIYADSPRCLLSLIAGADYEIGYYRVILKLEIFRCDAHLCYLALSDWYRNDDRTYILDSIKKYNAVKILKWANI
jgi:hypothetical protein